MLQLLAGRVTAPQSPPKNLCCKSRQMGSGLPRGGSQWFGGLALWGSCVISIPAVQSSAPGWSWSRLLCAGGRRSRSEGPAAPSFPPPGTNQGTEGEGTRGGWCEGSSELSPRWRGWGKAQRPPHRPPGEHPAQCKGIKIKKGGVSGFSSTPHLQPCPYPTPPVYPKPRPQPEPAGTIPRDQDKVVNLGTRTPKPGGARRDAARRQS